MKIDDDNFAVLRFGGGCQGCGSVELTLKDGVEKPDAKVTRVSWREGYTDHSDKSNAYMQFLLG